MVYLRCCSRPPLCPPCEHATEADPLRAAINALWAAAVTYGARTAISSPSCADGSYSPPKRTGLIFSE